MHDKRRTMRNVLSVPQVLTKALFPMSPRFDLIDLRLFVHVAEAGSITHGAVRANMTLASASERIRAMEDALSAPLLERKRRGVQLTSAGRVLLHHAWVVTQQLEQMAGELANFGKGLRGHVRLLSNIGAMEFLPAPLAAFLTAHPNIDVDLEHYGSGEIVRDIAAGRGDIGIVGETVDPARVGEFSVRRDPPGLGDTTAASAQPAS